MLQVINHPSSLLHEMGENHLEAPIRIQLIERALHNASFKTEFIEARKANEIEVLELHSMSLLETMVRSVNKPRMYLTGDTTTNMFTYEAALTAAGASIQVAEKIKEKAIQFAMVRPPGHHATLSVAMGFCFFNNVALSAHYLTQNGFNRVVILDIDNHHGNGTQGLFDRRPEVVYLSLHSDPSISFPGTGYSEEIGIGEGIGSNVNIPLPYKTGDNDYLAAFDEVIVPIIEQYKPEAVLISLGLDGLENDPYGALALSSKGYMEIGKRIGNLSNKVCKNKLGVILEGGYKFDEIGKTTVDFFDGMLNPTQKGTIIPEVSSRFEDQLRNVKAIQRNHWFGI